MLRWQLASMRLVFPVLVVVQILIAAGFSIGMSLFFVEVDPTTGLYLGTGAAIITLIVVGLVVTPQMVAGEKEAGTYDFSWSLPVPRSASVVSWVCFSALVSIPSTVAALLVAGWRLDLTYAVSWRVVPAVMLVLIGGTLIGYAIAHAISDPATTQLVSQVLAFGILGFTPITYPIENLPDWLAAVHRVLPFYYMGIIVRDGLTTGLVTDAAFAYLMVVVWTLVSAGAIALLLGRRR
jgi:ABC-2 type transport system permease protein